MAHSKRPTSTASLWQQTKGRRPAFRPLDRERSCSVCIIGAGIAGLSTAYQLTAQGQDVLVIDDGEIGGGETQRTTAHLSNEIDDRYVELVRTRGQEIARLAAESHSAAIDTIEQIVRDENIDCQFERLDGFLFLGRGHDSSLLESEREAAQTAGLRGVELLPEVPLASAPLGPCLRFPRQAQFQPLAYLDGLARAVTEHGGQIFTSTHAETVEPDMGFRIDTDTGHCVRAEAVVVATNTPMNDRVVIHTKQAPYRTYVIAARVPHGAVNHALYWDTEDPYHYVRVHCDQHLGEQHEDVLIIGGEDHKTGQRNDAAQRYRRLAAWGRKHFPVMGEIVTQWSGQVMETIDGLAFIGRNPFDHEKIYIATGDSGMGMTHGTIAGILLSDLIMGRENRWAKVFDPSRLPLSTGMDYVRENLNVAAQYLDWLRWGHHREMDSIQCGEGAIVDVGTSKRAVYRDEQGRLFQCSAVCPHLACVVRWNSAEKTWDCPCHGSRFDCQGHLLNGPANTDLPRVEEEEDSQAA